MTTIDINKLKNDYPLVRDLVDLKEVVWFNPNVTSTDQGLPYVGLTQNDVMDAQARLQRFAPYLMKAFPETASTEGIIESAVVDIPQMKEALEKRYNTLI
ncbi:D-serine dehydratase, partial [Proteus mirabilis]